MLSQVGFDAARALADALVLHRQGALAEAAAAYEKILQREPDNPEALQLRGVLALQQGRLPEALLWLGRAYLLAGERFHIVQNYFEASLAAAERQRAQALADDAVRRWPQRAAAHVLQARAAQAQGQAETARQAWLKVLALDAGQVPALGALALDAEQRGNWHDAAAYYRQLLPFAGERGAVLCNLGNALLNSGAVGEGRLALESAVQIQPGEMAAWHNLARAFLQEGKREKALSAFAEAQRLAPDNLQNALAWLDALLEARAWGAAGELADRLAGVFGNSPEFLLRAGQAAAERGLRPEAERCWQQVTVLQPRNAQARCNLARLALDRMDLLRARDLGEQAVRIDPGLAEAWLNLGLARHHLDDLTGARQAYGKAIGFSQKDARRQEISRLAHLNCGRAWMDEGDCEQAIPLLLAGGAAENRAPEGLGNLLDAWLRVADWAALAEFFRQTPLAGLIQGSGECAPCLNPFTVLALTDDPAVQLSGARLYSRKVLGEIVPWRAAAVPDRQAPIRLGYLSSDLHAHATSYLAADLFESHDRSRFRTYAYSLGPDDRSPMRQRVRAAFDVFRDMRGQSIDTIQQRIREDAIDILVDLKGHTFRALPEVFAGRPAPLQLAFLGFPGTLGTKALDYIIADDVVLPPAAQADFDEAPLCLPVCYQPQDRQWRKGGAANRSAHGLPVDGVVLACFNQVYKINAEVFSDWLEILRAVPETLLWLLEPGAAARRRLAQAAEAGGVEARRLVFAPLLPHADHLARLALADMVLDTFPYGAHTTASDALRCGVPVVTRSGRSFASRVAASLLTHAGLPELVTVSRAAYVRLLIDLARDAGARQGLKARVQSSLARLSDLPRFMQSYESALTLVLERQRQGLPPAPMTIRP